MKLRRFLAPLLFCCGIATAQQTMIGLQFFNADFNQKANIPGLDGNRKKATLRGIRLWDSQVKWSQVEISKGNYNWAVFDGYIDAAQANQLDVLYTFGSTPAFASTTVKPPVGCLPPSDFSCAVPKEQDWKDYVTAVVKRYKNRIQFYECWNEPDYKGFWSGTQTTLALYCKDAAEIIRANDPAATILSPSYHGGTVKTAFHTFVNAQKPQLMFDVLNFHMRSKPNYPPENFLATWSTIEAQIKVEGLTSYPVWDDEHGILKTDNINDPDTLASFVARELLLRASVPIVRQYVYFWDSPDTPLGLQLNPSGTAWNTVAGWLQNNSTAAVTISANGNIYKVGIGKNLALWNASKTCAAGFCGTNAYFLGNTKYTTQVDINGVETPIPADKNVRLGIQPILLK